MLNLAFRVSKIFTWLHIFLGDFFYQETNREHINPALLRKAIAEGITTAAKNGRKQPTRVIVFRDGLSEGQQEKAAREELPAIRAGIKDVFAGADPKITFVVGTKGTKNFFLSDILLF